MNRAAARMITAAVMHCATGFSVISVVAACTDGGRVGVWVDAVLAGVSGTAAAMCAIALVVDRRSPQQPQPPALHGYDDHDVRLLAAELERRYPGADNNPGCAAVGILDAVTVDRYRRDYERSSL